MDGQTETDSGPEIYSDRPTLAITMWYKAMRHIIMFGSENPAYFFKHGGST